MNSEVQALSLFYLSLKHLHVYTMLCICRQLSERSITTSAPENSNAEVETIHKEYVSVCVYM